MSQNIGPWRTFGIQRSPKFYNCFCLTYRRINTLSLWSFHSVSGGGHVGQLLNCCSVSLNMEYEYSPPGSRKANTGGGYWNCSDNNLWNSWEFLFDLNRNEIQRIKTVDTVPAPRLFPAHRNRPFNNKRYFMHKIPIIDSLMIIHQHSMREAGTGQYKKTSKWNDHRRGPIKMLLPRV